MSIFTTVKYMHTIFSILNDSTNKTLDGKNGSKREIKDYQTILGNHCSQIENNVGMYPHEIPLLSKILNCFTPTQAIFVKSHAKLFVEVNM